MSRTALHRLISNRTCLELPLPQHNAQLVGRLHVCFFQLFQCGSSTLDSLVKLSARGVGSVPSAIVP